MKRLLALCSVAVSLGTSAVHAHGGDAHRATGDATFGMPGDPAKVSRTIVVDMSDAMRFTPSTVTVSQGETVRFRVKNSGRLKHEMVLGTAKALQEHAKLMQKFPDMAHEDPNHLNLDPGKSGDLVWQFTKAGTFDFACLQPGHFDAGMRGRIVVK